MKSDIEIAQETNELPINEIAAEVDLKKEDLEPYGYDKAKISWSAINRIRQNKHLGKLILVTSISPTPAGEGKSTITIGLGDAIKNQLHKNTVIALREPSMGTAVPSDDSRLLSVMCNVSSAVRTLNDLVS